MQGIKTYAENSEEDESIQEKFVIEHSSLVKKIALHIKRRLPSHILLDDLLQSGFVGLLEAKQTYKSNMGASFETYASIRIRGSIIDSLRKNSWGTREISKNMRKIGDAIAKIEQRGQKQPTVEEIVNELGISMEEHNKICQQISVCNVISLEVVDTDNYYLGDDAQDPVNITQDEDIKATIKNILSTFPEREQLVLSLYYIEEFTFKQIGEILNLTEARICQLHSQAIAKIQTKISAQSN